MSHDFLPYVRHVTDEDDVRAVAEVVRSGRLTQGPNVEAFEAELCAFTGAAHAVCVSSGTAALEIAYRVSPLDIALIPAITFAATATAALCSGKNVIPADVDDTTLCVNWPSDTNDDSLKVAVDFAGQQATDRTRVHVLDAAHSLGLDGLTKRAGVVALSFHATKLVACGEGGAILTDDPFLAKHARMLRDHGRSHGIVAHVGTNARMDEMSAALGRSQLRKAPAKLAKLRKLAAQYDVALRGWQDLTSVLASPGSARHLYPVIIRREPPARDQIREALLARQIETQIHYRPWHTWPAFQTGKPYERTTRHCPVAEWAGHRVLSLPLHGAMTEADVERVVSALKAVL